MLGRSQARHVALHFGSAILAVALVCTVALLGAHGSSGRLWIIGIFPVFAGGWFVVGFSVKVLRWVTAPIAFRIPLTVGQQRSLASIRQQPADNPHTATEAILRTLVDVVAFRPLLRVTPSASVHSRQLSGHGGRLLWLVAGTFHASLLVILLRHLRLFLTPVPHFVVWLEQVDSLSDLFLPRVHISTVMFLLSIAWLTGRRLVRVRLRYVSLAADYFPLTLLASIGLTGALMRHVIRTDVTTAKALVGQVAHLSLGRLPSVEALFATHWLLVCTLLIYFPSSKLMHALGAFLSPTLTMANNNRAARHVNVCNPEVELHHYAEYEATFRERMIEAGLPVEEP